MNEAIGITGIILSFVLLYLVFGWKLRKHQDDEEDIYEQNMWEDIWG